MKIQRIFSALFVAIAFIFSNVSNALAMPPLPSSFYGTVKIDGANVPVGTLISARINGVQYASKATTLSGSDTIYSFSVPGDDPDTEEIIEGGVAGDTVVFYIGSSVADQTSPWRSGRNTAVNLTAATNHTPVANPQSVSTNEDTATAIALTGSDADGNPLTFAIVASPSHGALSGSAPNVTYTPSANYNGPDAFTFKVNDGTIDSLTATVSITVTAVNDVPVADPQSVSTNVEVAKVITLTGTDVETSVLTYAIVGNPLHGNLSGTAPTVSYTPSANYSGSDSFTFKVNDGTVDSAPATVSITINKINQTITFGALTDKILGAPDFTVSATSDSALTVSFSSTTTSVCTVSTSTVHLLTTGTCTIRASQAGNSKYNAATPVDRSFTVNPGGGTAITVTGITANNKIFDGSTTATLNTSGYSLVGVASGDTVTLVSSGASASFADKNVGTGKAVTVSGLTLGGADAYKYSLTQPTGLTANITAKAITVTPTDGQSKVYGAGDPVFAYSSAPALESGDSFSGALSRAAGSNVGSYAFSIGSLSAGSNYSLSLASGHTFAITAKAITVTPTDGQSKVYGAGDPVFAYSSAPALESGDSFSGALSRAAGSNVGTYAYSIGSLSAGSNYSLSLASGHTFAISAKTITVTPTDGQSKVYGAVDPVFAYSSTPALESGDSFSGALSRAAGSNVGTYAYSIGSLSAGSNYSLSLASGHTFAISAKTITVTPTDGQSKVYGAGDPVFAYSSSPALESGDSFSGALSRAAGSNVGSYAFSIGSLSAGSNYSLSLASGHTFAISAKAITVTPTDGQSKVYGAVDPVFAYSSSPALESGDSFSGALSRAAGSNVGSYAFSIGSLSAGSNYSLSLASGHTFAISAKNITVTPTDGQSKVYGAVDPVFAYTSAPALESGDSFSGALSRAAGSNVGTYAYSIGSLSAGSNYSLSLASGHTFAITKASQTITFGALTDKILGAPDFTVSATSDSALTVSFSSTTTSVCTVSTSTVHLLTTGTCTIRASQAGDANYNAATPVDRSFTVNPAGGTAITVTSITANNKIFDGSTTATLNTSGYSLVGVASGDTVTLVSSGASASFADKNVGTGKAVTVSGLTLGGADAYKYSLTQPTGLTANITAKTITVTPTDGQSKVYGAVDPVFAYTSAPALESGDSFSGALSRAAGSNVGSYAYSIGSLSAGSNYSLSLASGHTFAISAKAASVTPTTASKTYGAVDPTFSGTLSGFLAGDNVTAAYSRIAGENAGPYTISAVLSPAGVLSNYSITYNTAVFTINKKAASVTPTIASKTYGTVEPTLTGTLSNFLAGDNITAAYSRTAGENAGTYIISAVLSPAGVLSNYTITYNTANFTINPLGITITAQHDDRVYNGTVSSSVTPQITSGALVTGDTATLTQSFSTKNIGSGKTLSAAGSTINDGNGGHNYSVTFVNNTTGVITRYDLTVTAVSDGKGYDGTTSSVGVPTITLGTLQGSDTVTWSQTFNNKNAGTNKTLVPSGAVNDGNSGANYNVTFNTVSNGSITRRAITVTAKTDTREYDGTTSSSVAPIVTSGSIVSGDTGDWTQSFENRNVGTNKKLTAAGSVSDGNSGNNYLVSFIDNTTGEITIRSIAVTAASANKIYDGSNSSAGIPTITTGSLATGDTATWTQSFDNKNAANGKTLTPTGSINDGNGGGNYNVSFVTALGDITAADLNVTANDKIIIFGEADPIFDFAVSGFIAPDTFATAPTCSVADPHTAASTYPIVCSGGDAGTNYNIIYHDGVFTVSAKIILDVTASSATITYGDATPVFPSNITGFKDDDDASVLNTAPACTAGVGPFTVAGSPYTVTCSGGQDDKYDFNYIPGTLTVNPKALSITANNASKIYGSTTTFTGSEFTSLGLTGSDSVTSVTLTSSGAVNTANVGSYDILPSVALGSGLGNYTVSYTNGTLTVNPKALSITANNASKTYGATATFTGSEFSTLGLFGSDSVTSVTLSSSGAVNTANVGSYDILPSAALGSGLGNYTLSYFNGSLSVNKASLTVTAESKARAFGAADPAFTFSMTGFQNSENASVIDSAPTCGVSGAHGAPGSYPIICSGGADNNYDLAAFVDGSLTVSGVNSATFADVPMSYWAWKNIETLYAFGITGGCGNSPLVYCPTTQVTRAQMAVFLLRGIHGSSYTPPSATGTRFADVPASAFAAAWIEQLATEGITSGCGGGNFCPNQIVTRAQMAVFLVRAKYGTAYVPPTATGIFSDVPVGSFGADYIEKLANDGVTSGCGAGVFCPATTVKRDQMAVFLQRIFGLPLP